MPELPDVEMFRQYLEDHARGRTIRAVDVRDRLVVPSGDLLQKRARGRTIESTRRHGKYLLAALSGDGWIVMHFGMTGSLASSEDSGEATETSGATAVFRFEDGTWLAHVEQRRLGRVVWTPDAERFIAEKRRGPDALEVTRAQFGRLLDRSRGGAKAFLMNQRIMAGIGNIYADEMLFQAALHPGSNVRAFKAPVRAKLFRSIGNVLRTAIRSKVDAARMPRTWLTPHRRSGALCPRCRRSKLKTLPFAGRTSYFCPAHQRLIR